MKKPAYPMRINQYLAWKQNKTRRDGDKLVAKKCVFINGRQAVPGDKVSEKDVVEIRPGRRHEN